MVRGIRSLGVLLGILLAGCGTGAPPGLGAGVESEDIVGGATDSTDRSIFGILINNDALCSGSLIAPNLLLTARHCVAPVSSGEAPINCDTTTFGTKFSPSAFVATWTTDLNAGIPQNSTFRVQDVRVPTDNKLCGNDVALLILDSVVPTATAPTIDPRVDTAPQTPEAFSAIGYGLNDPNDAQGTSAGTRRSLGNLQVGCVGTECQTPQVLATEWAANSPMCSGDSGGPALDAQRRVIGVASRADDGCDVGFYSQVAPWKDLIVTAANDAATLGGYDVPTWAGGEPMDGGAPQAGSSAGGSTSTGGANATGGSATGGSSGGTANGGRGGSANAGQSSGGNGTSNATGGSASGGRAAATAGRGGRGNGTAGNSTGAAGRGTTAGTGGSAGTAVGVPDDAGAPPPDAGALGDGSLGDACNGNADCTNPLVCYTSNGKPPGSCVPACSAAHNLCPSGYECVMSVGACAPQPSPGGGESDTVVGKASGGCGCRVTPEGDAAAHAWQSLGVLALLGAFVRRRQIAPRR